MQLKHKLVLPLLLVLGAVMIYPLVFAGWLSLQDYRLTRLDDVRFVGLENFTFMATDQAFLNAMGNTLTFVFGAVALELALGLGLALLVQKMLVLRDFARSILLAPMFITPIAVGLMLSLIHI